MIKAPSVIPAPFFGVCFGILFGVLLALLPREIVAPFGIFILGLLLGLLLISHYEQSEGKRLMALFLSAYGIRTFLSVFFYLVSFFYQDSLHFGFLFINDGWAYHEDASRMVGMRNFGFDPFMFGVPTAWKTGRETIPVPYEHWNYYIYRYTGTSPLSMFMLNSFFGSLPVLIIYNFVRNLFGQKTGIRAATIFAFWPSLILWSTQNLKDPIEIGALTLFVSSLLGIARKPTLFHFAFLAGSWVVLLRLQKFLLLVALASWLMTHFVLLKVHRIPWMRFFWSLVLAMLCLLFVFRVVTKGVVMKWVTQLQNSFISYLWQEHQKFFAGQFQTLNTLRQGRATGGSAFLSNIDISSPGSLLAFGPLLFCFVWFGPFPWQAIGGLFKFFGSAEMLVFYSFMPAFWRGIQRVLRYKRVTGWFLISIITIIMLSIALLDANLGTAFRHRAVILPFVFVLIAVGWDKKEIQTRDGDG